MVTTLARRMQKPADCKSKRKQRGSNSVYGSLKEDNAEVAQLVEHNLAKVGVAGSSPVFRSRKKSLARMVELVDTRDLKSLGQ